MAHFRDIRPDLKARKDLIAKARAQEKERHASALDAFTKEEEMIQALMESEDRRMAKAPASVLRPGAANRLESEILEAMSIGNQWEHAAIKEVLIEQGLGKADDPNFGRVVFGTLKSLKHRGLVEGDSGVWEITKKGRGE